MHIVEGLFVRSRNIPSLALRTFMWSPWSHVAVVLPGSERVIDATFWHDVSERPVEAVVGHASKIDLVRIAVPDPEAGYAWLRQQVGKKYDLLGVLGIGVHQDWQDDSAWFCSELWEMFLVKCGRTRFKTKVGRITPHHSWMLVEG